MESDTLRMRSDKPYVMTNLKTLEGVNQIISMIEKHGSFSIEK